MSIQLRGLSRISSSDGKVYVFQGFSLLSHVSLDHVRVCIHHIQYYNVAFHHYTVYNAVCAAVSFLQLPLCKFVRFGGCYSINILKHPTMTVSELNTA